MARFDPNSAILQVGNISVVLTLRSFPDEMSENTYLELQTLIGNYLKNAVTQYSKTKEFPTFCTDCYNIAEKNHKKICTAVKSKQTLLCPCGFKIPQSYLKISSRLEDNKVKLCVAEIQCPKCFLSLSVVKKGQWSSITNVFKSLTAAISSQNKNSH